MYMRLLTINTHSIVEENYQQKTRIFLDKVAELRPDIIAMQEVNQNSAAGEAGAALQLGRYVNNKEPRRMKSDNHAATVAAGLRQKGLEYSWTWLPIKLGYNIYDEGAAVFCRKPIADTDVILLTSEDDYNNWRTRYALGIRPAGSTDWFYTVHMGWWQDEKEPFGEQWLRLQQGIKAKAAEGRVFLMGDFNSPAQVRQEGYDLITESGWHDTYLLADRKDGGNTVRGVIDGWRDKLTNEQMLEGMRIDHIWCNKEIAVKNSRICFDGENEPVVSDHFGLIIDTEE